MNLRAKSQKGFTIVELLIVIVVIAILAAISIVAFTGVQQRARDTQRAADAKTVLDAVSAYNADKGQWPSSSATAATFATETRTNLGTFTTVKVASELLAATGTGNRITSDAPTSTNKNYIQITPRVTGTAPNQVVTGANITYWSEEANATKTITAGS